MKKMFKDNINQTKLKKKIILNNICAQAFDFCMIFKTALFL